jgi:hypothetical protein
MKNPQAQQSGLSFLFTLARGSNGDDVGLNFLNRANQIHTIHVRQLNVGEHCTDGIHLLGKD